MDIDRHVGVAEGFVEAAEASSFEKGLYEARQSIPERVRRALCKELKKVRLEELRVDRGKEVAGADFSPFRMLKQIGL